LRSMARSSGLSSTSRSGSIDVCSTMFSQRGVRGRAAVCGVGYPVLGEKQT
jgi:hypothetical protein